MREFQAEEFSAKTLKMGNNVPLNTFAKQPQTIASHVIQGWNILIQNLAQKFPIDVSLMLFILLSVLKMKILNQILSAMPFTIQINNEQPSRERLVRGQNFSKTRQKSRGVARVQFVNYNGTGF